MAKLKYTSKEGFPYKGHVDGKYITLIPGAVFEVSEERAEKLKKDYPANFADTKDALSKGDLPKPAAPGAGKTPAANKAGTAASTKSGL